MTRQPWFGEPGLYFYRNSKMETAYTFTPEMIQEYPSICHDCEYARKPWSVELAKQGYVGCFKHLRLAADDLAKARLHLNWENIPQHIVDKGEFEKAATGWVCQGRPDQEETGGAFNNILMTVGCKKCSYFEARHDS